MTTDRKPNYLDLIQRLKRADMKGRAALLKNVWEKNLAYFKVSHPELATMVEQLGTGDYEIRVTPTFLEIYDRRDGRPCFPPEIGFLPYMQQLGAYHHTGWQDLVTPIPMLQGEDQQVELSRKFAERLYEAVPSVLARLNGGVIQLPKLKDGRRYSGATLFLGIFFGLHILHYLSMTETYAPAFVEPDWHKFALSCWFVDYQGLEEKFGKLVLHVGDEMPESVLDELIAAKAVTSATWLRILPAYRQPAFEELTDKAKMRWRGLIEVFVPFERELRNLVYGVRNLKADHRLMAKLPELSANSRIACVASGPSLAEDLPWLKENQNRLIIFAAMSAMRVLLKEGIRPDFQCTLDTELDEGQLEQLQTDFSVPLIAYYKINPEILAHFEQPYLVSELNKANPVRIAVHLLGTHPTTGNLTAAVAVSARPQNLYLLGYDMGFKDAAASHVKGSWYDDGEGEAHTSQSARTHAMVPANFPESDGEIFSHAYFASARNQVAQLVARAPNVKFHNLSDGAKINGAEPCRSSGVQVGDYKEKADDLAAICSVFLPAMTNREELWRPYNLTGAGMLEKIRDALKGALPIDGTPSFINVPKTLDNAFSHVMDACIAASSEEGGAPDLRSEVFSRLTRDLLSNWYRQMLFTEGQEEFSLLHEIGSTMIVDLFSAITWPEELDRLE